MKALALLSGGLDSRLAIKLILEQGIEVEALHFKLPFEGCCLPDCTFRFSQVEGIKLHIVDVTKGKPFQEFIKFVRKPKHGHGAGINPCIDCRIFMFKKAKQLAKKIKADAIVTGEVLGERPMSQRRDSIALIEKEGGLKGKILRPLSAKRFPETDVEKRGLVDRSKLLAIKGRRRNIQFELAKKYKLRNFPMPAGGCVLCEKVFAAKLNDLFKSKKTITPRDTELLKVGRHFRYGRSKIIVGRNEVENKMLLKLKNKDDYVLEVANEVGPITILQGKDIEFAAVLTASYSDAKDKEVLVKYGKTRPLKEIIVKYIDKDRLAKYRI